MRELVHQCSREGVRSKPTTSLSKLASTASQLIIQQFFLSTSAPASKQLVNADFLRFGGFDCLWKTHKTHHHLGLPAAPKSHLGSEDGESLLVSKWLAWDLKPLEGKTSILPSSKHSNEHPPDPIRKHKYIYIYIYTSSKWWIFHCYWRLCQISGSFSRTSAPERWERRRPTAPCQLQDLDQLIPKEISWPQEDMRGNKCGKRTGFKKIIQTRPAQGN